MLIARRQAGSIALGHMNDAVVSDDSGLVVDRENPQIVAVEILQFAIPCALDNFFLVMQLALAAHQDEIIGQRMLEEPYILALLSLWNRVGIGDKGLLQRTQRLGRTA